MKAPLLVFFVVVLLGSVAQAAVWDPAILGEANSGSLMPLFRYAWFDSLSGPPDTIYTDTVLTLSGAVMVHARHDADTIAVTTERWSPTGHYHKGQLFSLKAGESLQVGWQYDDFKPESAYHIVRESLIVVDSLHTESDSSFVTWRFWVLRYPHGDVKEGSRQPAFAAKPKPSIFRRFPAGAIAFDAMGRRALNPKPGVYFLKGAPAALPRKVLLVE